LVFSKKTTHLHYISWLILFKEIIPVYAENNAKPINATCIVS
jgi:hypothetical protein